MLSIDVLVLGAYFTTVTLLSLFGLHRLVLIVLYYRHRAAVPAVLPRLSDADCPPVLVQLPVFNERYVVERLVDAVAKLDWPRDQLFVQVLDDSTDDTIDIAQAAVERHAASGLQITHETRPDRTGFKAGALAEGLRRNNAPFVALFDADFIPQSDFLHRVMPDLVAADDVGMVQARWEHINRDNSLLTRAQAILLDGHFVMEHGARFRSGRFFNFNGTAGVWRRQAIDDAGGWEHDTLVEDLDLSYRAQLAGWRFVYRQDVAVPAELPEDARAFKSQQHRWAKGSIQAARKLLGRVWRAPISLARKIEATFHMGNNLAYPLMVALLVLLPMALHFRVRGSLLVGLAVDLPIFVFATANLALFYALSQREVAGWGGFWRRLPTVPFVLALGASLTPNNARATTEALLGHDSPFVRTPKGGGLAAKRYRLPLNLQTVLELLFGVYYIAALGYATWRGLWLAVPFVALFAGGFLQLGLGSLTPSRAKLNDDAGQPAAPRPTPAASRTPATEPILEPPTLPLQPARSTPGRRAEAGR
jgi:cellulose synthase/poly-beta-1,6-N-acetylglucosamine synthase-like glycosyltransferase